jgi:hypothetical protein
VTDAIAVLHRVAEVQAAPDPRVERIELDLAERGIGAVRIGVIGVQSECRFLPKHPSDGLHRRRGQARVSTHIVGVRRIGDQRRPAGADDEVDRLLENGWRPEDVALLATGSRHPEQVDRQAHGQDHYWASCWDAGQVFYGHVLGFKGLERRAVVLALNERVPSERSRERLYVGLSRARDQLVVCGDPAFVAEVGGAAVLKRLRG